MNKIILGMTFAGLLMATASLYGAANWDYSETDKTLTVTVASGTASWEDDDSDGIYRAYLTNNTVTNFVKAGVGKFYSDIDLSAYAGNLMLTGGTYTYTHPKAIGSMWSGQGDVRVLSGATLNAHRLSSATKDDWSVSGSVWFKRIYFEGTGAAGAGGALVYTSDASVTQTRTHFSVNLLMTGDATIYNASANELRMYGTGYYPFNLNMGGHTLTLDAATTGWGWSVCQIANAGNMVIRHKSISLLGAGSSFAGSSENVLSFADGGGISFNNFGGTCGWTLDARNLAMLHIIDGTLTSSGLDYSCAHWGGNILTGTSKLPVFYSNAVCNFTVGGVISGAGLHVYTQWRGGYNFNLTGSANTFTDGLTVCGQNSSADKLGNLHVTANGAIPAAGGPLTLTNATVTFETQTRDTLSLPSLAAYGTTAVNGGSGTWKTSVVKSGSGDLTWNSITSSETLEVQAGNVIVKDWSADRSQLAGLVAGDLWMGSGTGNAQKQYGTTKTNHVELSMAAMYDSEHEFWTTPFPDTLTTNPRRAYNYWGYIWNNDATNVTVSLAAYLGTHGHLNVGAFTAGNDATTTQSGAHYNNAEPMFATVELKPGATPIQFSGYYTSSCGVRGAYAKNGITWQANFGAAWKYGAATSNSTDYAKIEDPGDGSRFTWALPEQVVEEVTTIPGTNTVIRRAPYFGAMKFAAGTGVTFERGWYAVPTIEGLPAVTGITNALSVTATFKFKAAEVVAGGKLTTTGKFALGSDVQIVIEDPNGAARLQRAGVKRFTLVETTDGVILPDSLTVTGDTMYWDIERSDDGKKLIMVYRPKGLLLLFL